MGQYQPLQVLGIARQQQDREWRDRNNLKGSEIRSLRSQYFMSRWLTNGHESPPHRASPPLGERGL